MVDLLLAPPGVAECLRLCHSVREACFASVTETDDLRTMSRFVGKIQLVLEGLDGVDCLERIDTWPEAIAGLQEALSGVKEVVDRTRQLGMLLSVLVTERTALALRSALSELGSAMRDLVAPLGLAGAAVPADVASDAGSLPRQVAAQGFAARPGTDQLTWQLLRGLTLAAVGRGDPEDLARQLPEALAVAGMDGGDASRWGPAELGALTRASADALRDGDPILAFFCHQVAACLRAALDQEDDEKERVIHGDGGTKKMLEPFASSRSATATPDLPAESATLRRSSSSSSIMISHQGGGGDAKDDDVGDDSRTNIQQQTSEEEEESQELAPEPRKPSFLGHMAAWFGRTTESNDDISFNSCGPPTSSSLNTLQQTPPSSTTPPLTWPQGLDPGPLDPCDLASLVEALGSERHLFRQWVAATVLEYEAERAAEPSRARLVSLGVIPAALRALRASDDSALRGVLAGVLRQLARDGTARRLIAEQGGIAPLASLLQCASSHARQAAARALSNVIVGSARNKREAAQFGAVHSLTRMAERDGAMGREAAAATLGNLAANCEESASLMVDAGSIVVLSRLLDPRNNTLACVTHAARALRNLAGRDTATKALLLREGAVPKLVGLLSGDEKKKKDEIFGEDHHRGDCKGGQREKKSSSKTDDENPDDQGSTTTTTSTTCSSSSVGSSSAACQAAASALSNLACNYEPAQSAILSAGAVPLLVSLVCATFWDEDQDSSRVVITTAGGCPPAKTKLPRTASQDQQQLYNNRPATTLSTVEAVLWALSNLCGGAAGRKAVGAENGALLPCIVAALQDDVGHAGVRYAAVRLLKALALARDCPPVWRHEALTAGVVPSLVALLISTGVGNGRDSTSTSHVHASTAKAAAAVLGTLVTRSSTARRDLIRREAVGPLVEAMIEIRNVVRTLVSEGEGSDMAAAATAMSNADGLWIELARMFTVLFREPVSLSDGRNSTITTSTTASPHGSSSSTGKATMTDRIAAEAALKSGTAAEFVTALRCARAPVAEAAAAALGALCIAGSGDARRAALDAGALPALMDLLEQALLLPAPADAGLSSSCGQKISPESSSQKMMVGSSPSSSLLPQSNTSSVLSRTSTTASAFAESLQTATVTALGALASEATAVDLEPVADQAARLLASVIKSGGAESVRSRAAAGAISDLACCGARVRLAVASSSAPGALIGMLRGVSSESRAAAALALWDVCYDCVEGREAILKADGVPLLVQLLHLGDAEAKEAGAACLGEVAGLGPVGVAALHAAGALPSLEALARAPTTDRDGRLAALNALRAAQANAAPEQLAAVSFENSSSSTTMPARNTTTTSVAEEFTERMSREEGTLDSASILTPSRESDGGLLASLAATEVL